MKVFGRWDVEMDTSSKGSAYRATWREGKESITHHFANFTGMVAYLGMIDFYSFREYWDSRMKVYNAING